MKQAWTINIKQIWAINSIRQTWAINYETSMS